MDYWVPEAIFSGFDTCLFIGLDRSAGSMAISYQKMSRDTLELYVAQLVIINHIPGSDIDGNHVFGDVIAWRFITGRTFSL